MKNVVYASQKEKFYFKYSAFKKGLSREPENLKSECWNVFQLAKLLICSEVRQIPTKPNETINVSKSHQLMPEWRSIE